MYLKSNKQDKYFSISLILKIESVMQLYSKTAAIIQIIKGNYIEERRGKKSVAFVFLIFDYIRISMQLSLVFFI